jgi:hypothetical protein
MELEDVKVHSYTVTIIKDDQYIGRHLRAGYQWDGWMHFHLPDIVREGEDIIDIGGNIGWNALMFSEYSNVYTFEPLFHEILSKNADQNTTKHPITVYPYGLSNVNSVANFAIPDYHGDLRNYGGSGIVPDGSIQCEVKKLDDVYSGCPCLVKIDVEGHELQVLLGTEKTLRKHKPALFVEIFDFENSEVIKFLKSLGYKDIIRCPEHNYLFLQ